jgi:hypothetical protein
MKMMLLRENLEKFKRNTERLSKMNITFKLQRIILRLILDKLKKKQQILISNWKKILGNGKKKEVIL